MNLIITLGSFTKESFTECFSSKSYLRGNTQTFQLTLVLIPFENLDSIITQNLCKVYLDNKSVVTKLHFKDISFPLPSEQQVGFVYSYNQETEVVFQLTSASYAQILNYGTAMYELLYDVNLVQMNASISTISHTKMNGTNCFSNTSMLYRRYKDIELHVVPLNCQPPMQSAEVFFQYFVNTTKVMIPIQKCQSSCLAGEYEEDSIDF